MSKALENLIIETLIIIPGITGIAPVDFNKLPRALPKKRFNEGIFVESSKNGCIISISIIIEQNVSSNVITKEVHLAIRNILNKENIKLETIKIYIRGVR